MSVPVRRQTVATLGLVVLVLIAGCAGGAQLGGGGGDGGRGPAQGEAPVTDVGRDAGDGGSGGSGGGGDAGDGPGQVSQRSVIMTGEVELQVDDFDATQRNLTAAVERYGGFVSDSHVEVDRVDNASYRTGLLVLRVPNGNFSAMMARAQAAGEVQLATTSSEDVTDQLVDLDARLENLRAERDRLRGLYRNASDTEDVLAVEERLSEVQGEIERLEAQQQSLERQVALSTIRVELREPRPEPGPLETDRWFDTPVVAAFLDSVDGVVTSLRALVVAGAYGLPYAVVYGPLIVGVGYAVRRWRRRDNSSPAAVPGESTSEDATGEGEVSDGEGDVPDSEKDASDGDANGNGTSEETDANGDERET